MQDITLGGRGGIRYTNISEQYCIWLAGAGIIFGRSWFIKLLHSEKICVLLREVKLGVLLRSLGHLCTLVSKMYKTRSRELQYVPL